MGWIDGLGLIWAGQEMKFMYIGSRTLFGVVHNVE